MVSGKKKALFRETLSRGHNYLHMSSGHNSNNNKNNNNNCNIYIYFNYDRHGH